MRLFLDIGHCERSTKRGARAGHCMVAIADSAQGGAPGALLACAEAIADRPDGENAARAVTTALGDAYQVAEDSSADHLLREGMRTANHAVRASGERGRAAAAVALVLRGRHWYAAHAGHVRAWHYRDLQIKQLTRDHLLPLGPKRSEVTRACGYADAVEAEYDQGTLKEGDIFLLTTPGVHDALAGSDLLAVLQSEATAQQMADALVARALTAQTPAYAAACVARVEKLPADADRPVGAALPLVALPEPGATIDGYVIERRLLKSRRFRLYKATDSESGESVMMRFPDPAHAKNAQTFLREELIASRVDSPYLLRPSSVRPGRRTARYSVLEYRKAESLAKRIKRKGSLSIDEGLPLAEQLLGVLETMHRQGVIHGDVRPQHLLYDRRARRIYLLGAVAAAGKRASSRALSYCAPEVIDGAAATERGDIYAAGVTIYQMLTGALPYGKIRKTTDRTKLAYMSATQHREDFPTAIDDILSRACALDPADRYPTIAPFAAALAAVPIGGGQAAATPAAAASAGRRHGKNSWWIAAGLAAALFGYLYFALR